MNGGNAAGRTAGEGRRCRGDASSMTPPYYHLAVLAAVCASCLVCSTEAFQGLPLQGHGLSRLQQGGANPLASLPTVDGEHGLPDCLTD